MFRIFVKTIFDMETLIIKSKSKTAIRLLFEIAKKMGEKPIIESHSAKSLDKGLKELNDILKGKKKAKPLEELFDE